MRAERRFSFLVPVAAGGLDYEDVRGVVGTYSGIHDLSQWNIRKVASDPIMANDAAGIAQHVLKRRVEEISKYLQAGEPLLLAINTRKKPAFELGVALSLDWTHRFVGRLTTLHIVRIVSEALRQARDKLQPRGTVHLFLAVPAGLAAMIGQSLNTFGPIQTYEHVSPDAVGVYERAALLAPSAT